METIKKIVGIICVALAFVAEYWLVSNLVLPVASNPFGKTQEAIAIAQYTLIPVSIPVVLGGLICFGYYAFMGEYAVSKKENTAILKI